MGAILPDDVGVGVHVSELARDEVGERATCAWVGVPVVGEVGVLVLLNHGLYLVCSSLDAGYSWGKLSIKSALSSFSPPGDLLLDNVPIRWASWDQVYDASKTPGLSTGSSML